MRTSCSAGVNPSGTLRADAGTYLRAETGDAHHEEFVEVVGRYRQESHSLEQRVLAIGGLLENAAIEIAARTVPG